jgi:hypothetical protein
VVLVIRTYPKITALGDTAFISQGLIKGSDDLIRVLRTIRIRLQGGSLPSYILTEMGI